MVPILGLVLYGSRARGDHGAHSDVDLLAITADGAGPLPWLGPSVICHPLEDVLRAARSGDLFAYHVVSEGKAVYERDHVFARMRRAFCLRADYGDHIAMASDAGWFLLHHHRHEAVDGHRFNRRMAWCTHTIAVARAAGAGHAVFSDDGLARVTGCPAVAPVLRNKREPEIRSEVVAQFRAVLCTLGTTEPPALATVEAERRRFDTGKNRAGAFAIRAMLLPSNG